MILEKALFFDVGVLCEDVKWSLNVVDSADKIEYLSEPFYAYYIHRPSSIMNGKSVERILDLNRVILELLPKNQHHSGISRELLRESFYTIHEYCTYDKESQKQIYQCYQELFSFYSKSSVWIYKMVEKCRWKWLFHLLSVLLFVFKK